jgi:hypothetical protein
VLDRTGGFDLVDAVYPGFEGRPPAADLEAFLEAARPVAPAELAYATGVGALIALALRARGALRNVPLVLQGPVLWGLERRLMPRLVGGGLWPLLRPLLAWPPFQRRFAARQFLRPPTPDEARAFFRGYAECRAAPQLFRWLGPGVLRDLEGRFAKDPGALEAVTVWWGGRDGVVGPDEQRLAEEALGVRWPSRVFPEWGHYPMLDDPEGWVAALRGIPRWAAPPSAEHHTAP